MSEDLHRVKDMWSAVKINKYDGSSLLYPHHFC
jgi:hypothetical protein